MERNGCHIKSAIIDSNDCVVDSRADVSMDIRRSSYSNCFEGRVLFVTSVVWLR